MGNIHDNFYILCFNFCILLNESNNLTTLYNLNINGINMFHQNYYYLFHHYLSLVSIHFSFDYFEFKKLKLIFCDHLYIDYLFHLHNSNYC